MAVGCCYNSLKKLKRDPYGLLKDIFKDLSSLNVTAWSNGSFFFVATCWFPYFSTITVVFLIIDLF